MERVQRYFESDHLKPTRVLLVSDNFFALSGLEKAQLGRLLHPKDYGSVKSGDCFE